MRDPRAPRDLASARVRERKPQAACWGILKGAPRLTGPVPALNVVAVTGYFLVAAVSVVMMLLAVGRCWVLIVQRHGYERHGWADDRTENTNSLLQDMVLVGVIDTN